ncbi:hypothetical protein UFOVP3_74 [uncultured Caudovirales phage]|uniref:Uncharacterized protein n=1 Tax=uncultured Caudovirales phage TaxID=2100421 RepID=A0A6J5T750_9CAUD|nr:hypothetical protein UFOVP3_74 [uncultured Caudovirales phage]
MTIGKANPIRPADDQELIERLRMDHPDYLTKEAADRIEQIAATCEELVKELDYTEGTNDTLIALNQTLEAKLTECEARLSKTVEALRFYADVSNYDEGIVGTTHEAPMWSESDFTQFEWDNGDKARAALAELEGK